MHNNLKFILIGITGALVGAIAMNLYSPISQQAESAEQGGEKSPLYWVAPMDSNYRRDKPGKSPMGMDLVPVYQEDDSDASTAGAVRISPNVINNLGVRTAEVKLTTMQSNISTVGYVQYDEDQLVHIHPRVEGWIESLFVKAAGDPVLKGQPLYALYSPQLVNAQEELLIALKRNNQTLISAAKERLLALQLSASFIQQLSESGKVQQTVIFKAPQSGVVDGLQIREGFYVKPGTTLMSIAQLSQVWVEAEVFERDAARVHEGLPVTMTLDYWPAEKWQGQIEYVYPSLNAKTRTLRVRMRFANPDLKLKPNMFAQVDIQTSSDHDTLVVPKESVIRTGEQDRVVLSLGDGAFKSVAVTIGRVSDQEIEVVSGLEPGDVVVSSAQFLIDSESSKTSDFTRMGEQNQADSVWVKGTVNEVMASHRMVNIDHESVPEWQWPQMTMDFSVDESVDMDALSAGQSLHFEVTRVDDSDYRLTGIHIMEQQSDEEDTKQSATVSGVINQLDRQTRVLNISRDAIEKWGRPAATLDFIVAEGIELENLETEMTIRFTFEVGDDFVIVAIEDPQNHEDHSSH